MPLILYRNKTEESVVLTSSKIVEVNKDAHDIYTAYYESVGGTTYYFTFTEAELKLLQSPKDVS